MIDYRQMQWSNCAMRPYKERETLTEPWYFINKDPCKHNPNTECCAVHTHPEFTPYSTSFLCHLREALAHLELWLCVDASWKTKGNEWKAEVDDSLIRRLKPFLFSEHRRFLIPKLELHLAIVSSASRPLYSHNSSSFKSSGKFYSSATKSNLRFRALFILPPNPFLPPLLFIRKSSSSRVAARERERERDITGGISKQVIIRIIISITRRYIQPSHPSHSPHGLVCLIPQSSATTGLMHDSMHAD